MLWVKAFHIIFVVCWFAGLFYLPRLFVNHALTDNQAVRDHLKTMERKLYRFTSIFAVLTLIFGVWLLSFNLTYFLHAHWFHAKALCVLGLYAYHGLCGKHVQLLAKDEIKHSHVYYRWFNEAPVLILFAVVILVVVKPF